MNPIQLGIVEDEDLIRENLEVFFETQPDVDLVLVSESMEAFLEELPNTKTINCVLLDIGLPGMSGLEGIEHIKKIKPNLDILMLTSFDDSERIFKALSNGAQGYISKKTSIVKIKEAVYTVIRGGSFMSPAIARKVVEYFTPKEKPRTKKLTSRQLDIVEAIVEGLSYKMVADKLGISIETVRDHIKKIYKNLEINCKMELVQKRLNGEI